jgi:serine/threonine protein kinase
VSPAQGRNLKTGEIVAIKIVSVDETDQGLDPIRREISALRECNHPNIVRYFGSYFKDDYLWVRRALCAHGTAAAVSCRHTQIVMEYCGGGAVKDIVQILDRPLNEEQIAFVCREALKARVCRPARACVHACMCVCVWPGGKRWD